MFRDRLENLDHRVAVFTHAASQRLGFRGAALSSFSLFDLVWAWSLLDPGASRMLKAAPTYQVLLRVAPLWVWALVMAGIGILCGVQAWLDEDRLAFSTAIGIKLVWAALTVASWPAAGVLIVRPTIIFLTLATLVSVCAAGLPFRVRE